MLLLKADQNSVDHVSNPGIALLVLIVGLFCLSLNGCGWHLRGAMTDGVTLPPMQLQFQQASANLKRDLSQMLKSSGVDLDSDDAELLLLIHSESQGRRVLSVDSSGKVSEYELQYELVFSLREGGVTLINNERISQQRDYQFNEADVLAKREEERRLFDFMRSMSIQSLLRQLHSVTSSKVDVPQVPTDAD